MLGELLQPTALKVPGKGSTPLRSVPPQLPDSMAPRVPLTVHGHAHSDALLKAAQLALVPGDLVDDAAAVILAGVGGMEVLLDCAAKKALGWGHRGRVSPS